MAYESLDELDWEIERDINSIQKCSSKDSSNELNKKLLLRFRIASFIRKHADNLTYTDKSDYDKLNPLDNEEFNSTTTDALVSDPIKDEYPGEDSSYNYTLPQHFLQPLEKSKSLLVAKQILSWGEIDFVKEEVDNRGDLVRRNSDGELHSLYSPAIEWRDGARSWLQKGKYHRLDGPAIERVDDIDRWYYEDEFYGNSEDGYTQEKFEQELRNKGKIASQKLASDSNYQVLSATSEDVDELVNVSSNSFNSLERISKENLPSGYDSSSNFLSYIKRQKCFKLVDNDKIVGGVLLDGNNENIHLTRIFIDPEYQGKGLGKLLHNEIENLFQNKKYITTNTPESLDSNVSFYKNLGYEETGRNKNSNPPLVLFKKQF